MNIKMTIPMSRFLIIFLVMFCTPAFSQQQYILYFDSNKSTLTAKEAQRLDQWLSANKESKVVALHGFTDEDGTNAFNDTLAQKRVDFTFNYIQDKIKIRDDFKTRSFGETRQTSKIKAENRKVIIYYIESKDLSRENEILGIKPIATKPVSVQLKPADFPEKLIFDNPDGTKSEFKLDRDFMAKVSNAKTGEKLQIPNLNFIINTFAVVNESRGKMYELLTVMQKNPNLKIDIQGHLCCVPVDTRNLSGQRAKAIRDFLIYNGIDKSRLTYKGFGSSEPLYPIPEKSEAERAANRRVEIMIVENP